MKQLLLSLALMLAITAHALHLPDVVGSRMVLQQQTTVQLWGWAKPGSKVTVTPSWPGAATATATAAKDSLWIAKVATPEASFTPYTLAVTGDGRTITLDDVLVGEVWIAAGQSNMEMPLAGWNYQSVEGGPEAIAHSRQQRDRVRMTVSAAAWSRHKAATIAGPWLKPDPQTAPVMKAVPYFFARELSAILDVPVGVIYSAYGGTTVLAWTPEEVVASYGPEWKKPIDDPDTYITKRPAGCYNAMFWPIHRFTARGVIWYQGEADIINNSLYAGWYGHMVQAWRQVCGNPDMPFIATEIAPFEYREFNPDYFTATVAAELRLSQWRASDSIAGTYTVPTGDIGDEHIIHPSRKVPVGERLARMAANKVYRQTGIVCDAPRFERMEKDGAKVTLHFSNSESGFRHPDRLAGFEVSGHSDVFVPAVGRQVRVGDENLIELVHPAGETIRAVRYAFANYPAQADVVAGNGLPLPAFTAE